MHTMPSWPRKLPTNPLPAVTDPRNTLHGPPLHEVAFSFGPAVLSQPHSAAPVAILRTLLKISRARFWPPVLTTLGWNGKSELQYP